MVDFLTLVGVVVAIVLPIVVTIVALIIVVWQFYRLFYLLNHSFVL